MVSLRLLPERIDVVAESQRIASHVRSFERSRTFYDWCHYVSLIERKRGTLRNGESLRTEPEPLKKLQAILLRHKGDRFMAQNEPAWQNPLTGHAAERPYSGRVERLQRVESTSSSLA